METAFVRIKNKYVDGYGLRIMFNSKKEYETTLEIIGNTLNNIQNLSLGEGLQSLRKSLVENLDEKQQKNGKYIVLLTERNIETLMFALVEATAIAGVKNNGFCQSDT